MSNVNTADTLHVDYNVLMIFLFRLTTSMAAIGIIRQCMKIKSKRLDLRLRPTPPSNTSVFAPSLGTLYLVWVHGL